MQTAKTAGQVTDDGISFSREDGPQLLRPGDGEATGAASLAILCFRGRLYVSLYGINQRLHTKGV
ncbi:hypothetical protein CXF87_05345 [Halomonas sp. MES3-P3E]|nr:hypothetical protein CXF87_05345 [Halomonas sp. MES3-P3E]